VHTATLHAAQRWYPADAGHVIENPFALHYQTAEELIAIAEKLRTERGDAPGSAPMVDSQYTLCRAAFFQLVAAIEGLLNLVYEIYLKVELRDDRVADRLIREQIDVKLRLAPVYCDCFAGQPFDHTTQAFRNFHRLVNARNDFIHANVTRAMKTSVVNYDGIIGIAALKAHRINFDFSGRTSSWD
jgi:hypothetical protein